MKLRRNKKGFTIVELVIVIAVIGVLAAILIPTFINLTNKANKAADESLVKNLNTALAMQEQEPGDTKNNTMHDAVKDLRTYGYLVENLVTKSDDKLLWNQETNRFILEDRDADEIAKYAKTSFWRIQNNADYTDGFSIYAGLGFNLTEVTVGVGFDVGDHNEIDEVNYVRPAAPEDKQEVVIRTNGDLCASTINAPSDHVDHYGYAKEVNVIAVNPDNSYHEYGVVNELKVTAGKIVIENTAVVFDLSATASATATVIKEDGANVMGSSIDSVTASETFEINSFAQLEAFRDATNSGNNFAGKTINLNVDIALKGPWTPISNYYRKNNDDKYFAGTFNGNNHTITGLTNAGILATDVNTGYDATTPIGETEFVYGFFATAGKTAIIKNIVFTNVNITSIEGLLGDRVAACVGFYKADPDNYLSEYNISNITVSGNIHGYDGVGAVVGGTASANTKGYFKISDCTLTSGSTLTSYRKIGGIVGFSSACYSTFDNCKNYGSVASIGGDPKGVTGENYYCASGITSANADQNYSKTFTFIDCECTNTPTSVNAPSKVSKFVYFINASGSGISNVTENGTYTNTNGTISKSE